jgi:hypothetical protein
MTAADRMVVRRADGTPMSVTRRQGLQMISVGRATPARTPVHVSVELRGAEAFEAAKIAFGAPIPTQDRDEDSPGDPQLSEPRGNASRAVWATYAAAVGVVVSDDMTRNQIRDAMTPDRLPQPAREGGRLETPEDEPAPERVPDGNEIPGQGQ